MPRQLIQALLLALVAGCALSAEEPSRFSGASRVVVVADVHGAYSALTDLLAATSLVDEELRWTGGSTHLVSLGDLLDRGPESRLVMDLLMRLEEQAREQGGRVHVVLGNHELMNLIGDRRYVSAAEYAAFAPDETPEMRAEAYARFAASNTAEAADENALRAEFEQRYPAGYFAQLRAFRLDGRYGSWLSTLPSILVIDDTAFVHGGLPPLVANTELEALNDKIRNEVRRYLELRAELADAGILDRDDMQRDRETAQTALKAGASASGELDEFVGLIDAAELNTQGPMWYRGTVYCKPILEQPILRAALDRLDVARVVVGHTPTDTRRVYSLYEGKVVMLDTGMLVDYYSGRPAALVVENGRTSVQYLAPSERLPVDSGDRLLEAGLSRTGLRDVLATGTIVSIDRGDAASEWHVELSAGGRQLAARFIPDSGDQAAAELAAFTLDELLGTELLPPTVEREVDSERGALQLTYADAVTEAERVQRGLGAGTWCPTDAQYQLMYAFDLLTANAGRTTENLAYRQDLSDLILSDFDSAFGTSRQLPAGLNPSLVHLSPAVKTALAGLDEQTLAARLGEWLSSREQRALLSRRDQMLEIFASPAP